MYIETNIKFAYNNNFDKFNFFHVVIDLVIHKKNIVYKTKRIDSTH